MFNNIQSKYRAHLMRQSDADIADNQANFKAQATMTPMELKNLESKLSKSQFNYTALSNNFNDDGVRVLDSWSYCDMATDKPLLQLFSVHRKSVYTDGTPSKKLEQCESCGTFKERKSKGQMDTAHQKTLTEQAMMDQSAFDIQKLSCARCCSIYKKLAKQSSVDLAKVAAQAKMARKKSWQKYNEKRCEQQRNEKAESKSMIYKSIATASTALSQVQPKKRGRPYACQFSSESDNDSIEAFNDPKQATLGVRLQRPIKHLLSDVDSDLDTVYAGSGDEQEHTPDAMPIKKTKIQKQVSKKVKIKHPVVVPNPKAKRESRAIKFAIKGASTICEKDVMVQMLQSYANLVRGTTGFYITEASKTDKCRVLLLELGDASIALSRRQKQPLIPSGWNVQRVTFAQLLAFVGGTHNPDVDLVQELCYNFTWNLNFSKTLQGHVKQRVYTTHAELARQKLLRGTCLYVSLELALELYRLNPSTNVKDIPESMQNITRHIEQQQLIELLVDSMKLNRKGHAYYTQLVYVFDRNVGLIQQADYHLLFHINGRNRRYTVSVPKDDDTVWFSDAFQVFAATQTAAESTDFKFRDCREQYCQHTVTTDKWKSNDSYDVLDNVTLPIHKPQVMVDVHVIDYSITVGERKGIVVNQKKAVNYFPCLYRQDPMTEADQDVQSGHQMTVENDQTHNEYDQWENELVDLIDKHAEAQMLDEQMKTKILLQQKLCARLKAHDEIRKYDIAEKAEQIDDMGKEINDWLDYLWNYGQIGHRRVRPHGLSDQGWLDIQERFIDSSQLASHIAICLGGCFQCLRCDITALCGDGHLHIPRIALKPRVNVVPLPKQKQQKQTYKKYRKQY